MTRKNEGIEAETPLPTKIEREVARQTGGGNAILKHAINTIVTASLTFGLTMVCFVKQIWVNTEAIRVLAEKTHELKVVDDLNREEVNKRVMALAQNISENTAVSKELAATTKQSVYMLSVALGFEGRKDSKP